MQNIDINTCEKFHDDWLRNDRALGDRKSDNKNSTTTTFVAIGDPFPDPKTGFSVFNSISNNMKQVTRIPGAIFIDVTALTYTLCWSSVLS